MEVLVEQNINGKLDTAYIYGAGIGSSFDRLSLDRFDGSTGYYLYDPNGNVTGITNEIGQVYQSYRYDAFGQITFGAPLYENEYTYNGESYNPNIQSQYLRARYYNVVNAVFITEDTYLGDISEPLTLNRRTYCLSNPINFDDPSGNIAVDNENYLALEILNGGSDSIKNKIDASTSSMSMGSNDALEELLLKEGAKASSVVDFVKELFTKGEYATWRKDEYVQNVDTYMEQKAKSAENVTAYYIGKCGTDLIVTLIGAGVAAKGIVESIGGGAGSAALAISGGGLVLEPVTISITVAGAAEALGGYRLAQLSILAFGDDFKEGLSSSSGKKGNSKSVSEGGTGSKTYYHVTTEEAAKSIMETGQLKNGKWESHVFAWTQQPTKKQVSIAGIGPDSKVVLAFETNASFTKDLGNTNKSISNIVVQTVDGQRLPINVTNVREVGFKKPWWKVW